MVLIKTDYVITVHEESEKLIFFLEYNFISLFCNIR